MRHVVRSISLERGPVGKRAAGVGGGQKEAAGNYRARVASRGPARQRVAELRRWLGQKAAAAGNYRSRGAAKKVLLQRKTGGSSRKL